MLAASGKQPWARRQSKTLRAECRPAQTTRVTQCQKTQTPLVCKLSVWVKMYSPSLCGACHALLLIFQTVSPFPHSQ
jgi:hypothetical protein